MTFLQALEQVRLGKKIRQKGWISDSFVYFEHISSNTNNKQLVFKNKNQQQELIICERDFEVEW